MIFKDQEITKSLLWFLISIFLFLWIGSDLFGAFTNLKVQDLRITSIIRFDSRPIWFSIVVVIKSCAWALSSVLIFKYVKFKRGSKNT